MTLTKKEKTLLIILVLLVYLFVLLSLHCVIILK